MRCFIAVDIPQELKNSIVYWQDKTKQTIPRVKWVESGNLHITMKFLGGVREEKLETIKSKLRELATNCQVFPLHLNGLSGFPERGRLRVLHIDFKRGGEELKKIANKIEEVMTNLGFEKETRVFTPHLTLARVKDTPCYLKDFPSITSDSPPFFVEELVLYQSLLKPDGPLYTRLASFPLNK